MFDIETADLYGRREQVLIPTDTEIRAAKAAGLVCSGHWIETRRKAAKAAQRSGNSAARTQQLMAAKLRADDRATKDRIDRMIASIPASQKPKPVPTLAALKAKLAKLEMAASH